MTQLPASFLTRPVAHRALHDAAKWRPENSMSAIRAAIEAGYGIEIDLQISGDGQAMVFHDYELSRLTFAEGLVVNRSAEELTQISLKNAFECIPTLAQVLEVVDGQVPLLLELKDQDGQMGPKIGALEEATAKAIAGYTGPLAVMSFNPHSVAKMAELCPDVPRGIVSASFKPPLLPDLHPSVRDHLVTIPDYERTGSSFISHQVSDLTNPRVAELKAKGANVLCWTVKSPEVEAQAREIAENITFEQYLA